MTFIDQMQRRVELNGVPRRIISLVPSQTELLADLGLEQEVVGITKFCIHPAAWFQQKSRVGGTKTLNFNKIEALKPDLIIGNKEENEREQIEFLSERYPVWMSDVKTLEDALEMIRAVGLITGKGAEAEQMATEIAARFERIPLNDNPLSAVYLIWRKPFIGVGRDTFIDDMLRRAGFKNALSGYERYPQLTPEQLTEINPQVILLSSEPYPFSEKNFAELREICPDAVLKVVDGELFSWYGSRLLEFGMRSAECGIWRSAGH